MVLGQGWDERSWPDPRPPTRAELDEAGRGRAVYLARVDVHSAVVSSGLLGALPGVEGLVGYRTDGLLSQDAHHACRARLDLLTTDEERRHAAEVALAAAAALGVGEVHELGGPHLGPLADLTRVVDAGARTDVRVVPYWGEAAGDAALRPDGRGRRARAGRRPVRRRGHRVPHRRAARRLQRRPGPGRAVPRPRRRGRAPPRVHRAGRQRRVPLHRRRRGGDRGRGAAPGRAAARRRAGPGGPAPPRARRDGRGRGPAGARPARRHRERAARLRRRLGRGRASCTPTGSARARPP